MDEQIGSLPKALVQWIKPSGKCLVWTGKKNKKGYGWVRYRGRLWFTHRLIWTLIRGAIPKGWVIHHVCYNHACCRPSHLRCMTSQAHKALHARERLIRKQRRQLQVSSNR